MLLKDHGRAPYSVGTGLRGGAPDDKVVQVSQDVDVFLPQDADERSENGGKDQRQRCYV